MKRGATDAAAGARRFDLFSPNGKVRAVIGIETVWIGQTVYPEVPVWRVWYNGKLVIGASFPRIAFSGALPVACGMGGLRVTRKRPAAGQKVFRAATASCADRAGRRIRMAFLLADNQLTCTLMTRKRPDGDNPQDASVLTFPDGAEYVNPDAPAEGPHIFFSPSGKLVVYHRKPFVFQAWFYDTPGDLVLARTPLLPKCHVLRIETGAAGVSRLFDTLPFLPEPPDAVEFSDSLTPAFRAAFLRMLVWLREECDDRWMARGLPGDFAILACRKGAAWSVAAVSATVKVLTFRMEDLWLRTPEALRAPRYDVEIERDPNEKEPASPPVIRERFPARPADIRILLDVPAGGGCVIAFAPAGGRHA